MKNIVIFDDYHERDLKPPALLREYLRLSERDVAAFLLTAPLREVPCPACRSSRTEAAFEKWGMAYKECDDCGTLYVSPRPDDEVLSRYDAESEARRYWRETLAPGSGDARREKIVKPRSEWVVDSTREHRPDARAYADVSTSQPAYVEELAEEGLFERVALVDPAIAPSETAVARGVTVARSADGTTQRFDVVTLLEVADRTSDVESLFVRVLGMLGQGGLLFMTDVLASGFDIQMLWERAENVFPPDRLNVFTVEGLRALFERHGLEPLEFSTPGILDVEIVSAAVERDPGARLPRFARALLRRGPEVRRAFQEFLQAELFSSYGRALVKRS